MIKVLVVDDSIVQQNLLIQILQSDPSIKIVGTAFNGEEAIEKVQLLKPDIVTMDIHMPKMNGIEATRRIMTTYPVPIIIVSSSCVQKETKEAFEAMDAGALTILDKLNYVKDQKKELIETVKLMSEIKVVRRYIYFNKNQEKQTRNKEFDVHVRLIAIGASTGGPSVLQEIFKNIHKPFPPILVVQHIAPDFLEGLVEWLINTTSCQIKIAKDEDVLESSWIYFAPSYYQMGLKSNHKILISKSDPENGHVPSVSYLFKSIAKIAPKQALGVLLTGMGRDGADGLKAMKDRGSYTIAQNEKSAVIYGMPGEAVAMGAAQLELNPSAIAEYINGIKYDEKTKN